MATFYMVEEESNDDVEACEGEEALMEEKEKEKEKREDEPRGVSLGGCYWLCGPIHWLRMLADETHWSFVFGVLIVNGVSQGLGGAFSRVGTEYYMKDVQKVQPSESQIYQGIVYIPWLVKPIWGLFTDVLPIFGFRRRPYLILAGLFGVVSMLFLSLHENLHLLFAVLSLTAGSASVAIGDVTVDACVTENSICHPSLAPDMQSLCALSEAAGSLVGFFIVGVLVHLIGPKGVFGLLTIPAALVVLVGILLEEPLMTNFPYNQVSEKFIDAGRAMWTTLKIPEVWRPCLYVYLSIALSVNIQEGLFYWYIDSKGGPSFSQETVGLILSIGSVGSLVGAILYQTFLKNHPFRDLFFWSQLLFGLSGMIDLVLVLQLNLKLGMPDYLFVVIDECVSQLIARLKWMPILVLSSKLCPPGIEGTFFALLMSIENLGVFTSSWGGGLLLHLVNVTRVKFDNLWLAIVMRTILRISPLCLLFLVPRGDQNASILPPPSERLVAKEENHSREHVNIELVALISSVDGSS